MGLLEGLRYVAQLLRITAHAEHPTLDDATPIGPCIVSNNAIPDPQRLGLKCVLNGKTVQDGSTAYARSTHASARLLTRTHSDQIFTVRQTVAFLSQGTTLLPGSVIMTGTPKGVGFVKKPPLYLKNGDQVTVWVDGGIGSLVNDVVEEGKGGVKARL